MGAVWRADDEVLARQVAVKILHPALFEDGTFATRFRREARLLAALNHPGIVDVHDYGESGEGTDDRIAYIVMELVDGQPLHEALAESGPMPAERALGLLAEALDALHAAHRRDIVHRDIKPSNLMLGADGRVTVTDFGIARALASTKITASHSVLGTALYMAPEQAEGAATTPACDLYAIGVVCYELLTGETPFTGERARSRPQAHQGTRAGTPGRVPRRGARLRRRRAAEAAGGPLPRRRRDGRGGPRRDR